MNDCLAQAMEARPYSLDQKTRDAMMLTGMNSLTAHHHAACPPYRRIVDGAWGGQTQAEALPDVPYLPVSLFKLQLLRSVPEADVRVTLTSSGTTGQAVSRIVLDGDASSNQQRALANSLMHVLGPKRLPMLVIDTDAVFKDPKRMSARGAGVLGLMRYGRDHCFALDRDEQPDFAAVSQFLEKYHGQAFFMFGFTFMVWIKFYEQFKNAGFDLSHGVLIHSGGWKKLIDRAVDNATFRASLADAFGLIKIHNFYGMVEQIGSIFLEGPGGLLYPPNFADVVIRDPQTWKPAEIGQSGVIQMMSLLPTSYPGHSVLTEDLGFVDDIDSGIDGWMGKGIRILGRIAKAELRGCSDVIAAAA